MTKGLIVFLVALLNILIVVVLPKSFIVVEMEQLHPLTERHKEIVEVLKNEGAVSMDDLKYIDEQGVIISEKIKEIDSLHARGGGRNKVTAETVGLVSLVTLISLTVLCIFGLFGSEKSLVYFSVPSMLILLLAPIAPGLLFLIVIVNMLIVYIALKLIRHVKDDNV